jgi:hypothetical protein
MLIAGGIYFGAVYIIEAIGTGLVYIWDFFILIILGLIDFFIRVKNNAAV